MTNTRTPRRAKGSAVPFYNSDSTRGVSGGIVARFFDRVSSGSLQRREMLSIVLLCVSIVILGVGGFLLAYPAVISQTASARFLIITAGFFGCCALCLVLAGRLAGRQAAIGRLQKQIREERSVSSNVLSQASVDLLETLGNFGLFQDQLMVDCRRAAGEKQNLTVLVVTAKVIETLSEPGERRSVLGYAARAISRKLRDEDSVYILSDGYFGVILPGVDTLVGQRVSARLVEGLTEAAGASHRFSFDVHAVSYPEQTSSTRDLELAVTGLLPEQSPATA